MNQDLLMFPTIRPSKSNRYFLGLLSKAPAITVLMLLSLTVYAQESTPKITKIGIVDYSKVRKEYKALAEESAKVSKEWKALTDSLSSKRRKVAERYSSKLTNDSTLTQSAKEKLTKDQEAELSKVTTDYNTKFKELQASRDKAFKTYDDAIRKAIEEIIATEGLTDVQSYSPAKPSPEHSIEITNQIVKRLNK